jgi:hypothetical protein
MSKSTVGVKQPLPVTGVGSDEERDEGVDHTLPVEQRSKRSVHGAKEWIRASYPA